MQSALNSLDQQLSSVVTGLPAHLRPLMKAASLVGQPIVMMAIAVTAATTLPQYLTAGILVILSITASSLLKLGLRRTRPDTYIHRLYRTYSFPSGHAVGTLVTFGLVICLIPSHTSPGIAALVQVALGFLIGLIGISRVYLGAHYPSDVIGGWLLGLIALIVILATSV